MTTAQVLHPYICGAGPATRIHDLVSLAHDDGWDVYCVAPRAQSSTSSTRIRWRSSLAIPFGRRIEQSETAYTAA